MIFCVNTAKNLSFSITCFKEPSKPLSDLAQRVALLDAQDPCGDTSVKRYGDTPTCEKNKWDPPFCRGYKCVNFYMN